MGENIYNDMYTRLFLYVIASLIFFQPFFVEAQTKSPAKKSTPATVSSKKTAIKVPVKVKPVSKASKKPGKLVATETAVLLPVTPPRLEIEKDVEQPKSTLLLAGAQRVPFLNVTVKAVGGDVLVKHITVARTGAGSNQIFSEVGVLDVDDERGLNADNLYKTQKPFTLKAGESRTLTVFGNIASDLSSYAGQMPSLSIVDIETDAPAMGPIFIAGTAHTANSTLAIGTMTIGPSSFDPGVNKNIFVVNDRGVVFSAVRITVGGQEPILFTGMSWFSAGSVALSDLENLKTYLVVNGKTYYADAVVRDDGKFLDSEFGAGIRIEKGDSAEIYIKGDNVSTSLRTIDFDVLFATDLVAVGATYGQTIGAGGGDVSGVASEGQSSEDGQPFYNGYAHQIVNASVNIGR